MGITGLLPFVQKSTKQVKISDYAGCTVAVDAYCWLHKGAFSCSEKLAKGEPTDQYVTYCMKYINMLLSHNIKPILVFDGRHLPAKAETEKSRREKREMNKRRAAELFRMDKGDEARHLLKRCVDVTHEMALALIKQCRSRNVDCIVAPYEADAQLAYLNIRGIVHIVITEDSDLLLFGCKKVIFKMDLTGQGLLVDQDLLPLSMKQYPHQFSIDKFRQMCILSGCDYLSSLPGIGLVKACKFVKLTAENNMEKALKRLPSYLNMNHLEVTVDYIEKFLEAEKMFLHQPVFDPVTRKVVNLTPYIDESYDDPLLTALDQETAKQLAYGNLDPFTLKKVDDWDPDMAQTKRTMGSKGWNSSTIAPHKSIWDNNFKNPKTLEDLHSGESNNCSFVIKNISGDEIKKNIRNEKLPEITSNNENSNLNSNQAELKKIEPEVELESFKLAYPIKSPPFKKACLEDELNTKNKENSDHEFDLEKLLEMDDDILLNTNRNPFAVKSSIKSCRGLAALSKLKKTDFVTEKTLVKSKYFFDTPTEESPLQDIANTVPVDSNIDNFDNDIILKTPTPKKRNIFAKKSPSTQSSLVVCSKRLFNAKANSEICETYLNHKKMINENDSIVEENINDLNDDDVSVRNILYTSNLLDSSIIESGKTPEKENPKKIIESLLDTPPSSQESPLSLKNAFIPKKKTVLQPARRIGLSKKTPKSSKKSCYDATAKQTLLTQFAFQSKAKMKA